jgi:cleavage and polyadenylation specificity factor subunit 1
MSFQVKNFVLFGDIHKSIYFLCWKEDGAQLTLLAKDFGALDCYTTEFLIDGSTLSLLVSDSHKNLQVRLGLFHATNSMCTGFLAIIY